MATANGAEARLEGSGAVEILGPRFDPRSSGLIH